MKTTALITGITGQDGSYLAELLLGKGYKVYGLIRHTSTTSTANISHIMNDITLIDGDLMDFPSLTRAIKISKPDEIYNLGAMSHVGQSFHTPMATFEQTAMSAIRMLEAFKKTAPLANFYQASSSEMFGSSCFHQNEQTTFRPQSPYAVAKLAAHNTAVNFRETYGLHISCGILFNHESPRRSDDFVTKKIVKAAAKIARGKQQILLLGDLEPIRDWGYAPDYVKAMWLMLQQDKPDDYVIGTGKMHSVRDLVQLAFKLVGLENWQTYVDSDITLYRPNEVTMLCADARKAASVLDWQPTTSFEEMLSTMVEHELKQLKEK